MKTNERALELVSALNKAEADMVNYLITNGWKQVEDGDSMYGSWSKSLGEYIVVMQTVVEAVLFDAGQP